MAVKKKLVSQFASAHAIPTKIKPTVSGFATSAGTASKPRPNAAATSVQALSPIGPASVGAVPAPYIPGVAANPGVMIPGAGYDEQVAGINKQHDTTKGELTNQRTQGLLRFGYTASADNKSITVDPSNPFSQAAMLKRNYDHAGKSNTNSYASRGFLYDSSLQHAQNDNAFKRGAAGNTLENQLHDFLTANAHDQAANDTAQTNAIGQAGLDRPGTVVGATDAIPAQGTPPAEAAPFAGTPGGAAAAAAAADPATGLSPGTFGPGGPAPTFNPGPKSGFQFLQNSGTRAGLSYNLVMHHGAYWRRYENGDLVPR